MPRKEHNPFDVPTGMLDKVISEEQESKKAKPKKFSLTVDEIDSICEGLRQDTISRTDENWLEAITASKRLPDDNDKAIERNKKLFKKLSGNDMVI